MIKLTKTYTRPTIFIPWVAESTLPRDEYLSHFNTAYKITGKCITENSEVSNNGLTLTYTAEWATIEDYEEYSADPILINYWAQRNEYYFENGVTVGPTVIE